ncbi:MAG: hypothetical protein L3J69_14320 [Desulfobacula sp.]|nr:hypothetical protein [Desulfobacula sp.]
MKKRTLSSVAFILILSFMVVTPLLAETEFKANGWLGTKSVYSTRATGGSQYPTANIATQSYTHLRARARFEVNQSDMHLGAVWYNEVDFDFGRGAYLTGRGQGGGLGADSTNLETKNLYLFFELPDAPIKGKLGIHGVNDDFGLMVMGNDTAGLSIKYGDGDTRMRFGAYRLWDSSYTDIRDNVDYYTAAIDTKLNDSGKIGAAFYYLKDTGNDGSGALNISGASSNNGYASLSNNPATSYNALITSGTDYSLDSYFLGVFGEYKLADGTTLSGFGIYNFGDVDVASGTDIDISGYAAELRANKTINNVSYTLGGIYVSGSDKDADQEFGFTNTGLYSSGSNFYYRHGMAILLSDGNDWQNSGAYIYNVSNIYEDRFLGVTGLFANVGFPINEKLKGKLTGGALWSAEDRVVNGSSYIGAEINGALIYTVLPKFTISLKSAFAFTGDFYEVSAAQAAASAKGVSANTNPDDVSYSYVEFKLKF